MGWPDQARTLEALDALDLLVSFDVTMSQTAKRSTHVFASTMCLEIPGYQTASSATVGYANAYSGYDGPWAQYTPAVAERPTGSDLIEEWEVFYELGKRLGLQLSWVGAQPFRIGPPREGVTYPKVDMTRRPTHDEILERWTATARVPLATVKEQPSGGLFPPDEPVLVGPKDNGWTGRLEVANAQMMRDLGEAAAEHSSPAPVAAFRLLNRRGLQINSNYNIGKVNRGRFFNPLFVNPDDLAMLGLTEGAEVEIRSARGGIRAIAQADRTVMRGTVSMQHCFGDAPSNDEDVVRTGSPVNRLLSVKFARDPYSGQPVMSNVAVRISAVDSAS